MVREGRVVFGAKTKAGTDKKKHHLFLGGSGGGGGKTLNPITLQGNTAISVCVVCMYV